jgi:division/cell wall cluster transcriptional repressor MraZ
MLSGSRYIGEAQTIIDAKNRITLPAKFRSQLPTSPDGSIHLYVAPGPDFRSLEVFDKESGERRMDELAGDTGLPDVQQRKRQELLSKFEYCECDKQGRVLLPASHVSWSKLNGEVRVSGRGDHLLLYSPAEAKAAKMTLDLEDLDPAAISKLYEEAKLQGSNAV